MQNDMMVCSHKQRQIVAVAMMMIEVSSGLLRNYENLANQRRRFQIF
jgi:hypothetical protein